VVPLNNGNVVVTNPNDSLAASHAGAVYLFNGVTGALVGTLVGSHANDQVGLAGITVLANGNYVVHSYNWANGSATQAGAVTLVSGSTGLALNGGSGTISTSNSLTGSHSSDQVGLNSVGGNGIIVLANGNYVVESFFWANGGVAGAGAVTLVSGSSGLALANGSGTVSTSNSLTGSQTNDGVGGGGGFGGVTALANGNYVVASPRWANGSVSQAGAVTLVSGSTGLALTGGSGTISPSNSLVGSHSGDLVGVGGVTALSNDNYVVDSDYWANGSVGLAGAVTLVSDSTGLALDGGSGIISSSNSLTGSHFADQVGGFSITALANGNYVVDSPGWANGSVSGAGAVTLVSGSTGLALNGGSSTVSTSNSLTGSHTNDFVGNNGVTLLANGNYVVGSPDWANGSVAGVGAVTLVSGSTGLTLNGGSGTISPSNSLVGSQAYDDVGRGGVTALDNENYVVNSYDWANGSTAEAGAVTLVSGSTGLALNGGSGLIFPSNSLVGSQSGDEVGHAGVAALGYGYGGYVVASDLWANGGATKAGAVTLVSSTSGLALKDGSGVVSSGNSLVGSQSGDEVGNGGVKALDYYSNGNYHYDYVVDSDLWANGSAAKAGAVTLVSSTSGLALKDGSGTISPSNSLVGSQSGDEVGNGGVTVVQYYYNGNYFYNYVVDSNLWANGSANKAGAVTLVSGNTGLPLDGSGPITPQNSLVGQQANARLTAQVIGNQTLLASAPFDGTGRVLVGLTDPNQLTYATGRDQDITVLPSFLTQTLDSGTAVVLQASNDITVNAPITVSADGHGGNLTLQAGRSILLNASITTDNGNLTLIANDFLANGVVDSDRLIGNAVITMAPDTTLNAGTGSITINLELGIDKTNPASGAVTLQTVTAASLAVSNAGPSTTGSDVVLDGPVTTTGPQTFSNPNGTTDVNANLSALNSTITFDSNTAINSGVSIAPGSGVIDFAGSGTQTLSGGDTLGNVLHNGGTLQVTGSTTLTGSFTNTSGTLDATNQTLQLAGDWTWGSGTFVSTGSTVQLDGGGQALTSGGQAFSTLTHAGTGTLTLVDDLTLIGPFTNSSGNLDANGRTLRVAGNWTWSGGFLLAAGSTVHLDGTAQVLTSDGQPFANLTHAGTGPLSLADGLILLDAFANSGGDFNAAGNPTTVFGSVTIAQGTTYNGGSSSQLFLAGASVAGTLVVDGNKYGSDLNLTAGGLLGGTGTVGAVIATGGTLSPGDPVTSTGVLHAGAISLDSASTFTAQVNGTTPGSGYDQLNVNGPVNLDSDHGAGATLSLSVGYASQVGDSYTLIHSTGGITGTFASLPQGTIFTLGGNRFSISYTANGGTDVVVTRLANPTWTGTTSTAWCTAQSWSTGVLPGAGDNVTIPTHPSGGRFPVLDAARAVFNLTIQTGATLTLAGHSLAVNGTLTNQGTVIAQGIEAIHLASGNDTTEGIWKYVGDGSGHPLTLADFGLNDYFNLVIDDTHPHPDTFQTVSDLVVKGTLTIMKGTFTGSGGKVTTAGVSLSGGVLNAPAELDDSGNWTVTGGVFNANNGTVVLNGTNQHLSGNTTFFNLSKLVSVADTLTFAAGSTQTIGGTLTLQGAAGNLLALRSSAAGKWKLKALGAVAVQYADVQLSDAVGASITDTHGHDSGSNTNWDITT